MAPSHVAVRFHLPHAAELVVLPEQSEKLVSDAADLLVQLGLALTLTPARAGLVIDRVRHGYFNEGLALLGEGVAAQEIDAAGTAAGYRAGPLALLDEEGLEVSASLCAADASVVLLAEPEAAGLADRRIVIAADDDAENVRELPVEGDVLPGTIEVTGEISWEDVAALLVDEPEAQDDVRAARLGDEDAFERAAEADLLWYDVTEREALAESLGV